MEFIHKDNQIAVFSEDGRVLAEVTFPEVGPGVVNVDHTYVSDELRGQGIAGKLMNELVKDLECTDRKAVLTCSYAVDWFDRHDEAKSLISSDPS